MKSIALCLAAVVFTQGTASAADDEAPVRFTSGGITVVLRKSMKPISIHQGVNYLGTRPAVSFTCESAAGCAVDAAVSARINGNIDNLVRLCAYVDGRQIPPGCGYIGYPWGQFPLYLSFRGNTRVSPGVHSIQAVLREGGSIQGEMISGWSAQYEIYELTRPAN